MTRRAVSGSLVAAAVIAWVVVANQDLSPHQRLTDIPVYDVAARRITDGAVPYRDFAFEYPPLAAALITIARIIPLQFSTAFSLLMLVALCATVLGVVVTARTLGMSRRRQLAAGGVVALLPLLLGDFVATRFDLALAALLAWMLWAAAGLRWRTAWALLAAAVALKLAPIVLVPLLVIWHRRHRGGRVAAGAAGLAGAGVIATFLPFLALSPGGVWRMFAYHLDRPLQIESLGSAYLLGLHALADIPLRVETTFGSQNLIGDGPVVIAAISTALVLIGVIAVCVKVAVLLRRTPGVAGARLFVTGAAATVAVAVTAGKVLSPQFLVWIVPAALLVSGRYGRLAFATTVGALVATQLYFPVRYWDLVALETGPIALLVIRNTLLIVLLACAWPRSTPMDVAGGRRILGPLVQALLGHQMVDLLKTAPMIVHTNGSVLVKATAPIDPVTQELGVVIAPPRGDDRASAPGPGSQPGAGRHRGHQRPPSAGPRGR